jgi:hypothetical protein
MDVNTIPNNNAFKLRYEKALKVVRKYKNQYQFETEISKELAKR